MNSWVISDTHFFHHNIIDYCHRPFHNVHDMNARMIRGWNERVAPEDHVYHLGDVGFFRSSSMKGPFTSEDDTAWILQNLPGKKFLVCGNHDKSAARMMELGFDFACESMVLDVPGMAGGCRVVLNHYPLPELPRDLSRDGPAPRFVLHGHIHNSTAAERVPHVAKRELVEIPDFNINCSVEMQGYEPMTLSHVIRSHMHRMKIGELRRDPHRHVLS